MDGESTRDSNPTLRRAWPRDLPDAAICVQDVDVQCVLQFTLIHAAGCALHRHTSRVIHRLELSVTAEAATISFQLPRGTGSRSEGTSPPHPFQLRNSSVKTRVVQGGPSTQTRTGSLSLCEDASPTHERSRRARYPRTTQTEIETPRPEESRRQRALVRPDGSPLKPPPRGPGGETRISMPFRLLRFF